MIPLMQAFYSVLQFSLLTLGMICSHESVVCLLFNVCLFTRPSVSLLGWGMVHILFIVLGFFISIVALKISFLLCSKVNQLCICI